MPTPSDDTLRLIQPVAPRERALHTTCPPDSGRVEGWRTHLGNQHLLGDVLVGRPAAYAVGSTDAPSPMDSSADMVNPKTEANDAESSMAEGQSPMSLPTESRDVDCISSPSPNPAVRTINTPASSSYEFSNLRVRIELLSQIPPRRLSKLTTVMQQRPSYTSSFLRAGSKFQGTQQSDRQVYKVEVDIKHVDMNESFLCGYLRIEGVKSYWTYTCISLTTIVSHRAYRGSSNPDDLF